MLRWFWNKLAGSANRRDAVLMAVGAGAGQAITLALSPIIARQFSPNDFGAFSIYAAIIGVGAVLCTMRYEYAVPIVKHDEDAGHLFRAVAVWTALLAVITFAVITVFREPILVRFELSDYGAMMSLIPLGMAAFALFQLSLYASLRQRRFATVATSRAVQGGAIGVGQASFGSAGATSMGLAGGHVLSSLAGILILLPVTRALRRGAWSWPKIRSVIHRYRDFVRFSAPAALVNVATVRLPSVVLTLLAGSKIGGSFMFCQTILAAPVMLFGRAIGQVYVSELASRIRDNRGGLTGVFVRLLGGMALLGAIPATVLFFVGESVFTFIFGEQWTLSGAMSEVLAFVFFAEILIIPVTQSLEILEQQRTQLYWDIGRLLVIATVIVSGLWYGLPALSLVRIYTLAMLVCYAVLLILIYRGLTQRDVGSDR